MIVVLAARAGRALKAAPPSVQKAFVKQIHLLQSDLRHPSLQVKRYHVRERVWQARVKRDWRFYFTVTGHTIEVTSIVPHPK